MMTRRKRVSIVVLVLLIFLLLVSWLLYVLFSGSGDEIQEEPTIQEVEEPASLGPLESDEDVEEERETRVMSSDVVALAKTFIERYGSYSNTANFENLSDVLPLMSDEFAKSTRAFIETTESPEEYYGVSTRVIAVNVDSYDEDGGIAQLTITTQREEATDSPQNTSVAFQDIVLTFVTEERSWKVDSATWQ